MCISVSRHFVPLTALIEFSTHLTISSRDVSDAWLDEALYVSGERERGILNEPRLVERPPDGISNDALQFESDKFLLSRTPSRRDSSTSELCNELPAASLLIGIAEVWFVYRLCKPT